MKRKAEDSWNRDSIGAPRPGCCQPSLFCDSGDRFSAASICSNASDDTFSLSSNPYMFVNLDTGATTSRRHSVGKPSPSKGRGVNNVSIGAIGHPPEAIANIDGEKLLASEMQAMSVNEREEIYEEIHIGVRKNEVESPQFIEQKLHLFEHHLIMQHQPRPKRVQRQQKQQQQPQSAAKEPYEHPSAYQQALFLAPRYVKDPSFRLLFLRSESFDITKAAAKFVKHFETKKKFFGADKLGKAIDFFDLEDNDVEALRDGAFHVVPNFRDRSGRSVFLDNLHCFRSTCSEQFRTQARLLWYAFMREMEKDIEAQLGGIIAVLHAMRVSSKDFAQAVVTQRKYAVVPSLPLLSVCSHFCMDNPQLRPVFSLFLATSPKPVRLRSRIHFGSDMECQYALSTYGITNDLLPYATDGSVNRDKMERTVTTLRTEDDKYRNNRIQQEANQGITSYATSLDVLIGKRSSYQNSKGTLHMQQLVEQSMSQYIAAKDDRFAKTTIFLDIVHAMKKGGARFLKRHDRYNESVSTNFQKIAPSSQDNDDHTDVWVVLDDEAAREKVAFAFRNNTRRLKNQKAALTG